MKIAKKIKGEVKTLNWWSCMGFKQKSNKNQNFIWTIVNICWCQKSLNYSITQKRYQLFFQEEKLEDSPFRQVRERRIVRFNKLHGPPTRFLVRFLNGLGQ